jgi:hypothetical protein
MILGSHTEEDYRHNIEGLTQSELSWMRKSPAHFHRRAELQRETSAMQFGTIFHTAILERRRFLDSYVVEPEEIEIKGVLVEVNRRVKAHREYLAGWRLERADKFIMSQKQYDCLVGMVTEIGRSRQAVEFIQHGEPEVVAQWDYRGRKCKGKADLWIPESPHGKVLVDFKKTQDASPSQFTRSIYNYAYDLQSAWYRRGFEADKVIIVAVEEQFPHAIGIYDMDVWLHRGDRLVDSLLDRLEECEREAEWPWYTKGIEMILPPTWVAPMEEEEGI